MIPHSQPWITNDDINSSKKIFQSKLISNGEYVSSFEKNVSKYLGVRYAYALSSGTTALIYALKTLNLSSNDEVILPTYVCKNVIDAIIFCGAKPVLCDTNKSGLVDKNSVKRFLTKKTKAIIAVHIYGFFCDIDSLRCFKVPIIEDACQAFGLQVKNTFAGNFGDLSILSFHATKCFTTGEGGMLLTNKKEYALKIKSFLSKDNKVIFSPMSGLQASLGFNQLSKYHKFIARRNAIRIEYKKICNNLNLKILGPDNQNFYFRFLILVKKDFENIKLRFLEKKIHIRKGVDALIHREIGLGDSNYSNSVEIFNEAISIPFYPSLTDHQISIISNTLIELFE